jgi:hypothetical protein
MASTHGAGLGLLVLLAILPARGWAGPDPLGAVTALVQGTSRAAGDLIGGAGLVGAAGIALVGDGIALLDDNRLTRPVLRGVLSGATHHAALAVSWSFTGVLEALRAEDIERLPEAIETYRSAAPFVGRLDTALSGGAAIRLGVGDLSCAPVLSLLRLVGADAQASALARRRIEARIDALGPEPLPRRRPEPAPQAPDRLP